LASDVELLLHNPVFRQVAFEPSYHGYGIQNFLDTDPHFGTREESLDCLPRTEEWLLRRVRPKLVNQDEPGLLDMDFANLTRGVFTGQFGGLSSAINPTTPALVVEEILVFSVDQVTSLGLLRLSFASGEFARLKKSRSRTLSLLEQGAPGNRGVWCRLPTQGSPVQRARQAGAATAASQIASLEEDHCRQVRRSMLISVPTETALRVMVT
jgi:hypothetical protein